jgi:hypothetical protein
MIPAAGFPPDSAYNLEISKFQVVQLIDSSLKKALFEAIRIVENLSQK